MYSRSKKALVFWCTETHLFAFLAALHPLHVIGLLWFKKTLWLFVGWNRTQIPVYRQNLFLRCQENITFSASFFSASSWAGDEMLWALMCCPHRRSVYSGLSLQFCFPLAPAVTGGQKINKSRLPEQKGHHGNGVCMGVWARSSSSEQYLDFKILQDGLKRNLLSPISSGVQMTIKANASWWHFSKSAVLSWS